MYAIYERITVAGPEIVGVRLTQAAYVHGLALALPEWSEWRARQESDARMTYIRNQSKVGKTGPGV